MFGCVMNMPYMQRNYWGCGMPSMGLYSYNNIFAFGGCPQPAYYACNPYNNIFYQMNMMNNMFMLGQSMGNNLLSVFSMMRPATPSQSVAFGNVTAQAAAPAKSVQGIMRSAVPAPISAPTYGVTVPPVAQPSLTGPERSQQKVKAINWTKLNPFKKVSEKNKAKKIAKAEQQKAMVSTQKNELAKLDSVGYNGTKGVQLAQDAAAHAKKSSQKYCAKYVKKSIERCGLGQYENGHAYECADILSRNNNFKEVKISPAEFDNLPAGCVVVYPRGDAGFSKKYGHIEIAMGNGKGVSDFINQDMKYSENARVFVPVSA